MKFDPMHGKSMFSVLLAECDSLIDFNLKKYTFSQTTVYYHFVPLLVYFLLIASNVRLIGNCSIDPSFILCTYRTVYKH